MERWVGRVEIVAKVTLWLARLRSAAQGLACSGWRVPDGMSQEMSPSPRFLGSYLAQRGHTEHLHLFVGGGRNL